MNKQKSKNYEIAILGLLTALMIIMASTPLGTISFGFISITIAHIPILLATLMLGRNYGITLALIFGVFSMSKAFIAPVGILDPLFQNPLISILPRLMIPITTYYSYKLLKNVNKTLRVSISVVIGNLTNTFFVYLSMYLFVRERFETIMGKSALVAIAGLVSTSTLIKTVIVVIITAPIVLRIKLNQENI